MKREFLTELGLEKEAVDSIMREHGKSVNDFKDKADQADTLSSQVDDYKAQLTDRDEQLQTLGEAAKGNEELVAEIEKQKGLNEETKTSYESQLQDQAFNHKLDNSLSGAKVKNSKAVRALLDTDSIKLDGDQLIGLDDQITALKESDSYLFETAEEHKTTPKIVSGGNPEGSTETPDDPFTAKLEKYN